MLLRTLDEVTHWAAEVNWQRIAFDTETTGLKWWTLECEGVSFCDGGSAAYISFVGNKEAKAVQAFLWERLKSTEVMIGHNLVFDLKVLVKMFGLVEVEQWLLQVRLIDTYLADFLLDERETHKLKGPSGCLERHLQRYATTYKDAETAGRNTKKFADYAQADAVNTWDLWCAMHPKLNDLHLGRIFKLECEFIPVLVEMEVTGVEIDQTLLASIETKLDLMKLQLLEEIGSVAGAAFSPQRALFGFEDLEKRLNSPLAVLKYLRDGLDLSIESVDEEALTPFVETHQFVKLLLEYRKVTKLLSTYVTPYWKHIDSDGRIRTSFKIVHTGRLSSSEPNITNIPKVSESAGGVDIRAVFRAAKGKRLLREDFSQEELRILASNSGDVSMLRAFNDGIDVHMWVANESQQLGLPPEHLKESAPEFKAIKKQYADVRTKFKAANFGLVYGRGAANLAKDWKCGVDEAKKILEGIFRMFPQVKRHIHGWLDFLNKNGYSYTILGRRRRYNRPLGDGELRSGFNHTVQGGAADMAKLAVAAIWRYLRTNHCESRLIMWIHDEIIVEGPEEELLRIRPTLEQLMCTAMPLKCRVAVDGAVVDNYSDKGE